MGKQRAEESEPEAICLSRLSHLQCSVIKIDKLITEICSIIRNFRYEGQFYLVLCLIMSNLLNDHEIRKL